MTSMQAYCLTFVHVFMRVWHLLLHRAKCLFSNSLAPGSVLAADPADLVQASSLSRLWICSSERDAAQALWCLSKLSSTQQFTGTALAQSLGVCVCLTLLPYFGRISFSFLPWPLVCHSLALFAGILLLYFLSCLAKLTMTLPNQNDPGFFTLTKLYILKVGIISSEISGNIGAFFANLSCLASPSVCCHLTICQCGPLDC